ncbi:MAG: hypothetical protein U0Q07_04595 [Acidimicrobiales bacterium]
MVTTPGAGRPTAGARGPKAGPHRPLPRRIALVGSGGAGKSTLATRLGAATGLPVVHLDRLYWSPGWVEPAPEDWLARVESLVAGPAWILDGNHGTTAHLRIDAADLVVLVDTPRWRCLWRVLARRLRHRGTNRPDMADGCPERLDPTFVRWVWIFPREKRPRFVEELHVVAARGGEAVRLRRSVDHDALVADLAARARWEGAPAETRPPDTRPADATPADTRPADATPADAVNDA